MRAISVRRLEPELHAWLQQQAATRGVSTEEEVRRVLRAARDPAEAEQEADRAARLQALFALACTAPPGSPSVADLLREDRDNR